MSVGIGQYNNVHKIMMLIGKVNINEAQNSFENFSKMVRVKCPELLRPHTQESKPAFP